MRHSLWGKDSRESWKGMATTVAGAGEVGVGGSSPCSSRQLVISSGLGAGHLHVATHKKARGHISGRLPMRLGAKLTEGGCFYSAA